MSITHDPFNMQYVEAMGHQARNTLRLGKPVAIDFQPDNGTRYEMVLTPASLLVPLTDRSELIPLGMGQDDDVVIVTMLNGDRLSYAFDTNRGYLAESYVHEKLGGTQGDSYPLAAFLRVALGRS